jgi:hypothetical protein
MSGGEMGSQEAEASIVVFETNSHRSFVARHAAETSLLEFVLSPPKDSQDLNTHLAGGRLNIADNSGQVTLNKYNQSRANKLRQDVRNGG